MIKGVKRMKRVVLAVAVLLSFACAGWGDVVCPGEYPRHLQGIATDDGGNIYWSFTTFLVKTDGAGALLAKVAVPSHYGDLTWHGDKVYVAVNYGKFNEEPGKAKSWVCVHDAGTLALLSSNAVPEVVHGAGGVEWFNGRFFVVGGLPAKHTSNYVYEYTESFAFVGRHVIASGQTRLGIQTVCRGRDGTWWFGCYGEPAVTLRTDDDFRFLGKQDFNSSFGIARTKDDNALLIAMNKKVSEKINTASARLVKADTIPAGGAPVRAGIGRGK